jgi:hypothetical protein
MRGLNISFTLAAIFLFACTAAREELKGIDWSVWKEDRNGCLGYRNSLIQNIDSQKEMLKARSEMDIVDLMGKPDQTELYKRNQKFFTYFVGAGPDCASSDSLARKLVIRFNAMGLAKEIDVE